MLLGRLQEPVGGGAVPRAHLTVGLASGRPGWWGAVQVTRTGSSCELMEGGGKSAL